MENKEDIKTLAFKALHALNAIKNLLDGFAENIEVTVKQDGKEIIIDPLPALENAMKSFAILAVENIKLQQQLAAKDKALDKACEQLIMYNTYDFDDMRTMKDWKEWAEHETN